MSSLESILLKKSTQIIKSCGFVKEGESVLIIVDQSTKELGCFFTKAAQKEKAKVVICENDLTDNHGKEPNEKVAELMSKSDVIFALTKYSIAHTKARINATKNGARYLSLPDYNVEQLSSSSLDSNFFELRKVADRIKEILDKGKFIRILTSLGTDIKLYINDRVANSCPGFCNEAGMLGSPPDSETNIAPIENKSVGTLVVDGSIPCKNLGLIKDPIKVKIKNGKIEKIEQLSKQAILLKKLFDENVNSCKVLAEFGIGLNPMAKLCGLMLEDEGCLSTVHFGFGSNSTIGGKNEVNFHVDFILKDAMVFVDDVMIMDKGELRVFE